MPDATPQDPITALRAAEFTARHWHQTALGSGHIPFVHAIACINAAIAGETDPNQLGLDPSVHDAFRAALGEPDDLIRERCPHCPQTLPRNRVDDHVTTAHADLPPCTASIHFRINDTTYRCAFRVGHNGEYGALHASAYAKRGGRYVWDDEHDGAIPHRDAEPAAPGWSRKADSTWTLLDSDRADTGWKQNSQPAPCTDCIAGAHDLNYHRRRRGLPPPPPSTEEQIVGALHELASSVRDLVSALRLETADRSNCATAHDIKGD